MILINLENLSETEIRYLAKEELENSDTLSTEEIIDLLKEKNNIPDDPDFSGTSVHKYLNSFISNNPELEDLPGVSPVPDNYNETSIHIVKRNLNWAYAYWNLSESLLEEIAEKDCSFSIIVKSYKSVSPDYDNYKSYFDHSVPVPIRTKDKEINSYEIFVDKTDKDWNIQLPWTNRRYTLSLMLEVDGEMKELCSSNVIECTDSQLSVSPKALDNPDTFNILISSLLSKSGNLIKNAHISETIIPTEVEDEEQD